MGVGGATSRCDLDLTLDYAVVTWNLTILVQAISQKPLGVEN